MNLYSVLIPTAQLDATLIRKDGSHRDMLLAKDRAPKESYLRVLYRKLRGKNIIPLGMTFGAFVYWLHTGDHSAFYTLVTTAGVNVLAADFVSGASLHIASFNYHDSGTGTTAEAIGQTTLVTQAGPTTRATGTQSNPGAPSNQYRSIGTISYTSTLSITEWGLFSQAAQGGSLWDRRLFSSIGVSSGDSISFSYNLQIPAGGS